MFQYVRIKKLLLHVLYLILYYPSFGTFRSFMYFFKGRFMDIYNQQNMLHNYIYTYWRNFIVLAVTIILVIFCRASFFIQSNGMVYNLISV